LGSIAHWHPVEAMYWIASQTVRRSVLRGRPTFETGGMKDATNAHSASVRACGTLHNVGPVGHSRAE